MSDFSFSVPTPDLGAIAQTISNQITDKKQEPVSESNTDGSVVATMKTFADLDQISAKRGELAALRSDLKTQQTSLNALQAQWTTAEAAHPDFAEQLAAADGNVADLPAAYKEAGALWTQLQAVKTAVGGISAQVSATEAALVAMGIDVGSPETDVRSAGDKAIDQNAQDLGALIKNQAALQTELEGLKLAGSDPQRQAQVELQLNAVKGQINDELQALGLAPTAAPTTLGGKTLGQIQQEAKQQALTDKSNASPEAQRARTRALNQEAATLKGEMKEIVTKGYTSNAERARYQMISNELLPTVQAQIASQPQLTALYASRQQVNDLLNKATDLASASPLLAQRDAIDAELASLQRPVQASIPRPAAAGSSTTGTANSSGTPNPPTAGTHPTSGTQARLDSLNLTPPAKPLWMTGSLQQPNSTYGKAVTNWVALKTELAEMERESQSMAAERIQLLAQIKSLEGADKQITFSEKADYQYAQQRLQYLNSTDLDVLLKQKRFLLNERLVASEEALLTSTSEITYNNRMKATATRTNLLDNKKMELLKLARQGIDSAYRLSDSQLTDYQLLAKGMYYDDNSKVQTFGSSAPVNVNFRVGRTNIEAERKALGLASGSEVIAHWQELATDALTSLSNQHQVRLADAELIAAKIATQTKRIELNALVAKGKVLTTAQKEELTKLETKEKTALTDYNAKLAAYNAALAAAPTPVA